MSNKTTKTSRVLRATLWGGLLFLISGLITGLTGVFHFTPSGVKTVNGMRFVYGVRAVVLQNN